MLLDSNRSSLLIVDVQEGLISVMAEPRPVYRNCATLMRAAARLGLPVTISEQYPKGLGHTVGELRVLAAPEAVIEKIHFSCAFSPEIKARLDGLERPQVVIAGIESHVCVLQSAIGLKEAGYQVAVVADACTSRAAANYLAAMDRMRANGIEVVTTEMVVFEWLHRAGTPEFKELSALIK